MRAVQINTSTTAVPRRATTDGAHHTRALLGVVPTNTIASAPASASASFAGGCGSSSCWAKDDAASFALNAPPASPTGENASSLYPSAPATAAADLCRAPSTPVNRSTTAVAFCTPSTAVNRDTCLAAAAVVATPGTDFMPATDQISPDHHRRAPPPVAVRRCAAERRSVARGKSDSSRRWRHNPYSVSAYCWHLSRARDAADMSVASKTTTASWRLARIVHDGASSDDEEDDELFAGLTGLTPRQARAASLRTAVAPRNPDVMDPIDDPTSRPYAESALCRAATIAAAADVVTMPPPRAPLDRTTVVAPPSHSAIRQVALASTLRRGAPTAASRRLRHARHFAAAGPSAVLASSYEAADGPVLEKSHAELPPQLAAAIGHPHPSVCDASTVWYAEDDSEQDCEHVASSQSDSGDEDRGDGAVVGRAAAAMREDRRTEGGAGAAGNTPPPLLRGSRRCREPSSSGGAGIGLDRILALHEPPRQLPASTESAGASSSPSASPSSPSAVNDAAAPTAAAGSDGPPPRDVSAAGCGVVPLCVVRFGPGTRVFRCSAALADTLRVGDSVVTEDLRGAVDGGTVKSMSVSDRRCSADDLPQFNVIRRATKADLKKIAEAAAMAEDAVNRVARVARALPAEHAIRRMTPTAAHRRMDGSALTVYYTMPPNSGTPRFQPLLHPLSKVFGGVRLWLIQTNYSHDDGSNK